MENVLKNKSDLKKIFKEVVIKCLEEAKDVIEKGITEENIERLNSYHKTLKRKLAAIKTLEDEIIELETDPNIIETAITLSES